MSTRHSAAFTDNPPRETEFEREVRQGLMAERKTLPCKYLYDDVGSALFDTITKLREYGCTRGELRLLKNYAKQILQGYKNVIELGGGNGEKASALLSGLKQKVAYHNIDISPAAVEASRSLLKGLQHVSFHGHAVDFHSGLHFALHKDSPAIILFLGSSIGNFNSRDAVSFLSGIHEKAKPGDALLLGTDLVKPIDRLLLAYDDPAGVTSAFNKNILARMNFQLGANFDLSKFAHEAHWNEADKCIEMHLCSTTAQTVRITRLGLIVRFAQGETILTERSHKYEKDEIDSWLKLAGWKLLDQWVDHESLFALNLARS